MKCQKLFMDENNYTNKVVFLDSVFNTNSFE